MNLFSKWFFFDPFDKQSILTFFLLNRNTGVIFFNNSEKDIRKFKHKIKSYVNSCKQRRIPFLIQNSIELAIKYNALGTFTYLNFLDKSLKFRLSFLKRPKTIQMFTVAHNLKEILISERNFFDSIFISPVYKTLSYENKVALKPLKFIGLCHKSRLKNHALGGISKKKFTRIKNKKLFGFGAITYFNEYFRLK